MRALLAAVIFMGVLILGGTAALVVVAVHRATLPRHAAGAGSAQAAPAAPIVLDEPAGTRIAASSAADGRLVLQLAGGGPDRVLVIGLSNGGVLARVGLAR